MHIALACGSPPARTLCWCGAQTTRRGDLVCHLDRADCPWGTKIQVKVVTVPHQAGTRKDMERLMHAKRLELEKDHIFWVMIMYTGP